MKVNRVKTYVKGLDKEMQGGIPEGSIILVAGKPGTMKSSFVFNILYQNACQKDLKGVYVTLEQSRSSLIANMQSLGMAVTTPEEELTILDLGMIRKKLIGLSDQTWMEAFRMYVKNLKTNMDMSLMAIDSLAVLEVMAKFKRPREELFLLFEWLRDLDLTVFIITEMQQGSGEFCKFGEDFLTDGIMHLDMHRDGNLVNLFLSIVKMRQTSHKRGYYPMIFDKDGFEIV